MEPQSVQLFSYIYGVEPLVCQFVKWTLIKNIVAETLKLCLSGHYEPWLLSHRRVIQINRLQSQNNIYFILVKCGLFFN